MVLGRAGLRLEAQKFALYLLIPISASIMYNEPTIQKWAADYFQFMKYPSNPKTNLMEEFEILKQEREEELKQEEKLKEARKVYLQQLQKLNRATGKDETELELHEKANAEKSWVGWLRRSWGKGSSGTPTAEQNQHPER